MLFAASPGDVPELRRRNELILYVVSPRLPASAEFLPANSGTSRENCSHRAGSQGFSNLSITFNAMYSNLSRIYKRQYSTIRFVHSPSLFLILTGTTDGATIDDRRSRVGADGKCPPLHRGQMNDLSLRTQVRIPLVCMSPIMVN